MASKPVTLPVWNTSGANRVTPSGGLQASGYANGDIVASSELNWFKNLVYQWAAYLDDLAAQAFTWAGIHTFSNTVNFDAAVDFDGAVDMSAALHTSSTVDIDSTLNVDGAAAFQTTVHVVGAATLDTTLLVTGAATLTGGVVTAARTNPSLGSGWTSSANDGTVSYWRDVIEMVHLEGGARAQAPGADIIFTLPAGSRPAKQMTFIVPVRIGGSANVTTWDVILIDTDGDIHGLGVNGGGNTDTDYALAGINFRKA